jgi:hypothetical protein
METRMISGEPVEDFRKERELGHSLIGSEVRFKGDRYDAVQGLPVATGETLTGIVQSWDDIVGCLRVQVAGELLPMAVKLGSLVQE